MAKLITKNASAVEPTARGFFVYKINGKATSYKKALLNIKKAASHRQVELLRIKNKAVL